MNQKRTVIYYLILSIAAAAMLFVLTFIVSSNVTHISIYRKLLVSGALVSSCIFGISLAIYPSWLKRLTKHGNYYPKKQRDQDTSRKYQGHHPDCDKFQNHRLAIRAKTTCAGCFGLSIGSILSIGLVIIYIVLIREQTMNMPYVFFYFGLIVIGLVFIEIALPKRLAIVHVVSNIFLVIGFFMVTIGIFEITRNEIFGLLSILFSFLWLDTRIRLSSWRHSQTCVDCSEKCKRY